METRIVEVTVFPDRARVTRRGAQALAPGTHRLEIAELPLALDPCSVRASGKFAVREGGPSGTARLLGVEVRKVFYQDTPDAQVRALEDQIQSLEDQDKALADQAEALAVRDKFARTLADKAAEQLARGVAFVRAEIAHGSALLNFVAQELAGAQEGLRQVAVQRRELSQQRDALRNQLQRLRGSRGRERYAATVEVEATAPGELTVDLTYMAASAGWRPLYDVRLSGGVLELTYLGQVTQRTGEDWADVSLALSTARPALAAVLPELEPWYLYPALPPRARAQAEPSEFTRVFAAPAAPAAAEEILEELAAPAEEQMAAVTAQVDTSGASVTFRLPQRAAIPADGEPHKVTVALARLEPKLDYVSVPKLAEFAYRRAKVKNADLTLLPGPASLFLDNDFIGAAPLRLTAPGEEFELHLGVDDRIYIQRELKARDVDKKFMQDKRRLRFAYETEVRNLRSEKVALEIHDQWPLSRDESVKVKLEAAEPRPAEQTELNELTWKLSLEPGAKQFVRFDFSVEHPRQAEPMGLP